MTVGERLPVALLIERLKAEAICCKEQVVVSRDVLLCTEEMPPFADPL